jgi:toxin ParE1/3/4
VKVVFSKRAQRQFETAAAWWRVHRDAAPYLLEDEVTFTTRLLEATPYAGASGKDARLAGARRVVLQQTQYFLYYRVRESTGIVEILRLWHTSRRPPKSR